LIHFDKNEKKVREQGCQIILGATSTKIYQISKNYTKLPHTISNGRKIDQMAIKYTNIGVPLQDPPTFTQIGIFGLKIYHLATLFVSNT
jgi:hypothetical protein